MRDLQNSDQNPPEKTVDAGLYQWASRELQRFIASRLPRRSNRTTEASELLGIVFERFCKSRTAAIHQPQPYLIRIAENVLNEFLLRESRNPITYDSNMANDASRKVDESLTWSDPISDNAASEQQLRRVLAQVPPMYRTVLVLRLRDGLSSEEISNKLGISPGTARIYFQRGMAACRAADWHR